MKTNLHFTRCLLALLFTIYCGMQQLWAVDYSNLSLDDFTQMTSNNSAPSGDNYYRAIVVTGFTGGTDQYIFYHFMDQSGTYNWSFTPRSTDSGIGFAWNHNPGVFDSDVVWQTVYANTNIGETTTFPMLQGLSVTYSNIGWIIEFPMDVCCESKQQNAGYTMVYWGNLPYEITAELNIEGSGLVNGVGTHVGGSTCTLSATANEGYAFVNWTEGGTQVSTDAEYTFMVTGDRTLVANFVQINSEDYLTLTVYDGTVQNEALPIIGWGACYLFKCEYVMPASDLAPMNGSWITSMTCYNTRSNISFGSANFKVFLKEVDFDNLDDLDVFQGYEDGTVVYEGSLFLSSQGLLEIEFTTPYYYHGGNLLIGVYNCVKGTRVGWCYFYGQAMDHETAFITTLNEGNDINLLTGPGFRDKFLPKTTFTYLPQDVTPTGAINGLFSVGEGQQVYFSQGNLQYQASTDTWRFANNQWDYVGEDNANISETYDGWIDLFGWGTSGWDNGNVNYHPWNSSNAMNQWTYYGPNGLNDLTGQYSNADWGVFNAISNGGNQPNQWRTLTKEEWDYLLYQRNTSSGIRYAKAVVNDVSGVILLPDNWDESYYYLVNVNVSDVEFNGNILTASEWTSSLEPYGAVFLPNSGARAGTSILYVNTESRYWSSSYFDNNEAYSTFFTGENCAYALYCGGAYVETRDNHRCDGLSVRLVSSGVGSCHVINAYPNPAEGGHVTGTGTYFLGEIATLTATANEGYVFTNWTENGNVVSTDANYSFTVMGDRTLVANFEQLDNQWSVVTGMSGSMTILGTLKIDGVEPYVDYLEIGAFSGTECRGSALPEFIDGYCVYSMNIVGNTDGDPITFHVYDHHLGQELDLYCTNELTFEDGAFYGSDEFYEFNFYSRVEIMAMAIPEEGGSVSGMGEYFPGEVVTLTADAEKGYRFVNWTENGEVVSTDAEYTFTVTDDRILVANFEEISCYWTPVTGMLGSMTLLSILKIDGVEPYVDYLEIGAFSGTECRGSALPEFIDGYCIYSLNIVGDTDGEVITFRLYDHELGEELDLYCANELSFEDGMSYGSDEFYEINFYNKVQITAMADPAVGGTVSGMGEYFPGTEAVLTATPTTGYHFVNWTLEGEVVSTSPEYTFMVTGTGDYVAHFALNSYDITVTADPTAGGSVTGAGIYTHGETVMLTATANTGYTFDHWTKDGVEVSTSATYSFTATEAGAYTAHFTLNSYAVTATAAPAEGGTIEGTGDYFYSETCTLIAIANEGWQFNSWAVDGETVSTETTYGFTVEGPVSVTALFDLAQTVELSQGWSWWSTNVEMSGIDGLGMLESNLNPFGRVIKSADKFVQYQTALHRWIGSLTTLANEEGYKVQAAQACTVTMVGAPANPEDHPITIHPNWTWIGYPATHPQTVGVALAGFNPEVNDIIKSQSSSARYLPNAGWIPADFTLNPGESYMYYSKAADEKTLVYANGRSAVTAENDDLYWRNDVHSFADNLCLLAVVEIDGAEQRSDALELGAFVNGECRGSAKLMYIEPLDRYFAMMTVMGEDGEVMEFALTDHSNLSMQYRSEALLAFSTDAIIGEFDDPYVVRFGGLASTDEQVMRLGIYPNPVSRNESFRLLVPEEETVTEWTVVNALGAVVRHEAATGTPQETRIEGLPVSGVYLVKVSCQSGKVYWNRLIVK